MSALLPLALLLATPGAAQDLPVPPASRWDTLPRLAYRPDYKPRIAWVEKARALQGQDDCAMPAGKDGVVRLRVPFAVLLDTAGRVLQAQAEMPGCPALARLIEQFARQQGPKTLVPPAGTPPFWRASHFLAGWPAQAKPAAPAQPPAATTDQRMLDEVLANDSLSSGAPPQ